MPKTLKRNVYVEGRWYGPAYPSAKVTDHVAAQITNEAAWSEDPGEEIFDLRFRRDDFPDVPDDDEAFAASLRGGEPVAPTAVKGTVYNREELLKLSSDDLKDLAIKDGHDIKGRYSKEALIDLLSKPVPAGGAQS